MSQSQSQSQSQSHAPLTETRPARRGPSPLRVGIMGPSRSGKDHAADWLAAHTCLTYRGTTSTVISREVARREGITYEEAHSQRHARKRYWRALGDEMRSEDPAALARVVLVGSNLLVGVRARVEMEAVLREKLVDVVFWVDRPCLDDGSPLPDDPTLEFGPELCHAVIQNWWGVPEYDARLRAIAKSMGVLSVKPPPSP